MCGARPAGMRPPRTRATHGSPRREPVGLGVVEPSRLSEARQQTTTCGPLLLVSRRAASSAARSGPGRFASGRRACFCDAPGSATTSGSPPRPNRFRRRCFRRWPRCRPGHRGVWGRTAATAARPGPATAGDVKKSATSRGAPGHGKRYRPPSSISDPTSPRISRPLRDGCHVDSSVMARTLPSRRDGGG